MKKLWLIVLLCSGVVVTASPLPFGILCCNLTGIKKFATILFLGVGLTVAAQTVSYWFYGFQHQPSAAAARRYLFSTTNSPSPGDTIRWDGTNFHWGP